MEHAEAEFVSKTEAFILSVHHLARCGKETGRHVHAIELRMVDDRAAAIAAGLVCTHVDAQAMAEFISVPGSVVERQSELQEKWIRTKIILRKSAAGLNDLFLIPACPDGVGERLHQMYLGRLKPLAINAVLTRGTLEDDDGDDNQKTAWLSSMAKQGFLRHNGKKARGSAYFKTKSF